MENSTRLTRTLSSAVAVAVAGVPWGTRSDAAVIATVGATRGRTVKTMAVGVYGASSIHASVSESGAKYSVKSIGANTGGACTTNVNRPTSLSVTLAWSRRPARVDWIHELCRNWLPRSRGFDVPMRTSATGSS